MAKSKATITLDKDKASKAAALVGGRSLSETVDMALDRLIYAEQLRNDLAAYGKSPIDEAELAIGDMSVSFDLADDDVDYEALYGTEK
jgi:hypothetical protein